MAPYNKFNNRPGGARPQRPSYGAARPSYGANAPQRELFDAECNKCHNRCQVPFRPNGKKPVYCANCFVKDENRGDAPYGDRQGSKPAFKKDYNSDHKPAFKDRKENRSFAPQAPNRDMQDLKKQMEVMNATLQKLVASLESASRPAPHASSLSEEVRKHASEEAPAKKAAPKAATKPAKAPAAPAAKKAAKTTAKKAAKKK